MAWVLPDERSATADAVLIRVIQNGAHVPFIFPAEFANGLTMAVRRGRIEKADRAVALDRVSNVLKIVHDTEGAAHVDAAIALADFYQLTVYDAIYLELAKRMRLPLATLDKNLAQASHRAGVTLSFPHA
jgi:predicted nucleic acid-binding protein